MPFQFSQWHGGHKSRFSTSLNSQHWRFLKSNLDYSREDFLPVNEGIIAQPARRPDPLLPSEKPKNLLRASQRSRKVLTEPQSYTSKLSLMSQTRKDQVAQVEYCLSQHPLALYPSFQESIPAELFREVMSILDPEMLPTGQERDANLDGEPCPLSTTPSLLENKRNRQTRARQVSCKDAENKAPYTWFSPTKVAARELKARLNYVPPLDENIKRATKELCDGFSALDPYQSRWKKIRYGAWYLDPKTWKKQDVNEPLENSKESSIKNSRRFLREEDAELIQLHGTHAFREFLVEKGYRIPEFLQRVLEEPNGLPPKVGALKNTKEEPQRCKDFQEDYS
ncbi:protein FAM47A-like isoform X2 [Crotalus tigris]|uniref:protein FAM47A-like isoform X2 n=1 Tax=Crotalus tigris TaxID=88082 RepID=UPI00192F7A83|nr:protein FAM47A-like isoform X2 [Crotalus tigris]